MDEKENLHQGHRQRLLEKFNANPDSVSTFELVEIFLFPFLPRINTNDIAHRLIKTFGSVKNIFSASAEKLMSVEGIGKSTAAAIVANAKILTYIFERYFIDSEPICYRSYGLDKQKVVDCFKSNYSESFMVFLLDKKHREITRLTFDDNLAFQVSADVPELTRAIAVNKPYAILIAHNHTSGNANPSSMDDTATAKIYMICNIHGVEFSDHVIVAGNKSFSYRGSSRLIYIEENFNIKKIFDDIDKIKE